MSIKCKKPPFTRAIFIDRSKFCKHSLKKGHPRNIPVKLFQNLTISFGEEDFLRISSCPYSARSPHSPEPCFERIKISRTRFEKGHSMNIPVKSFQNLTGSFREEDFLRISSCPYSAKSLPPTAAIFFDGSQFREQILKRVTQGTML